MSLSHRHAGFVIRRNQVFGFVIRIVCSYHGLQIRRNVRKTLCLCASVFP